MEPATVVDHHRRVVALLEARRYEDALALTSEWAALQPGESAPLVLGAWAEIGLRNLDPAERMARAAIALSPALPEAHQVLVAVLTNKVYRAGKHTSSRLCHRTTTAAKALVALAPDAESSHAAMVDAYAAMRRWRGAVASSDILLELAPNSPSAWLLRARAARCAGDFEVAEAAVLESLRLRPDDYDANNELGLILRRRGRTADAIAQFHATAAIDPIARPARVNLTRVGAVPFQFVVLLVTSPMVLVVHNAGVWILLSVAINAALWRLGPSRRWLEKRALSITSWRGRRPTRRACRNRDVPPATPIQAYRNQRTVLVLAFFLLLWAAALITGVLVEHALDYTPVCLIIDVPTCWYAWWVLKRIRPRPAVGR